jgi:polysaccharide export outer membrane protein
MFIAGCARVSQVVDEPVFGAAEGKIEDASPVEVEITPLTNSVAATLNAREAKRRVLQVGDSRAEEVNAGALLSVTPLPTLDPIPYRIGVGDTLSLARFITARGFTDDIAREQVVISSSKVSADGSILFIETGRISIEGLTLAEARELAANALIRNGIDPRFQLEVSGLTRRVSR